MTPEQQKAILRAQALQRANKARAASAKNQDGTYGQPPEGMFMNPQTGQMTSRELMQNALPTSRAGALAGGVMQGYSLDAVDEAAGAIGGEFMRERARAQLGANAEDFPVTEAAGRVVGAVMSPVNKVLGPVRGVKDAAKAGGAYGVAEGFMAGEGGLRERALSAATTGATGALFGGMTERLGRVPGAVASAFRRADERPTIDALKGAKNAAYAAVRRAGVEFNEDSMQALAARVNRRMNLRDFDEAADPQTAAALRIVNARSKGPLTLNRLDKIRQNLWDRYSRSDEVGILDIIGEIDNTIERAAEGNDLLMAARAANKKYAKAQLLENAFRKARLQTSSTGSGGNILNKYRQAVTRIITNPKEAKWFSQEELALMERFVEGDDVENVLRRVGKLAPGGNGLMTALNVYAATVDPAMLAVTGIASAAKEGADRSALKGSEEILDAVSTGVVRSPTPKPDLKPLAVGGASGLNALVR